jgi:hypothetical protein
MPPQRSPPLRGFQFMGNAPMSTETFMVAFHKGHWRIGYEGQRDGT